MSFQEIDRPVNLTLLADRLGRQDAGRADGVRVLTHSRLAAEICAAGAIDRPADISGRRDEILVVIAGYGYLTCADGELIELTEGDVLFVPAASPEFRFERLSPNFRTWRIGLCRPEEIGDRAGRG